MFDLQRSDTPSPVFRRDGLYGPSSELEERGGYPGYVAESSLYTKASLHPLVTGAIIIGAGLALAGLLRSNNNKTEITRSGRQKS